ncbi:GlmU family protein [soil metagenome]
MFDNYPSAIDNTPMHVVIFEGYHWINLAPFSLSRPSFMLYSGAGTLLDKQLRFLRPTRITLWVRPEMVDYCNRFVVPKMVVATSVNTPLDSEPAQLISARTLHFAKFEFPNEPAAVVDEGDIIRCALVKSPGLTHVDAMTRSDKWLKLLELPHVMPQSRLVNYPWDLLSWNEESLVEDFVSMIQESVPHEPGPWHIINAPNVALAKDVKLSPGVVLDGSSGPIMIGEGASIGANSVIQGPAFIGDYTQVQPLTYIRPGVTVGPHCRIGGEISNSIFQGYANKSHYGFLGDSYVGEWVNLGAGTSTSNLKNTYDEVKMRIAGKSFDTGRKFVGAMIGDHTKTAIGTRLTTGSYLGFCCQLAGSAIAPKYVPSFSWINDKGVEPYRTDKAIQVMQAVYARRHKDFTPDDAAMVGIASAMAKIAEATGT